MVKELFVILFTLVFIVIACEIFANSIEHLGSKLKISEGVTGSLLAAVGTALPETIIPILALFAGTQDKTVNEEIGIGAILGAPIMLSTLSLFILALFTMKKRGINGSITPEKTGFRTDMNTFIIAFSLATCALFIPENFRILKISISICLVLLYVFYVAKVLKSSKNLVDSGHVTNTEKEFFLSKIKLPINNFTIVLQLLIGLFLIILGAKIFINSVEIVSKNLGISALLFSLIVIPIATEFPEKMNSILWLRRKKDTLAIGNISGAMVFQGTLQPAFGILFTSWTPGKAVVIGMITTLISGLWLRYVGRNGQIRIWHLFINGLLYFLYLALCIS